MKITGILPHLHSGAHSDLHFVEVRTDDPGVVGWGECTLPGKPFAVAGAIRDAARVLVGQPVRSIRQNWEKLYRHSYWRGGAIETSALSGIDMALWDIEARRRGEPVHQALGGAVRKSLAVYANCGLSTDPEELGRRAAAAVAQGFKIVKFYPLPPTPALPSNTLVSDVYDCCAQVRNVIGPDLDFAVDLHGRTLPHVVVAIEQAVRPLRPLWIEEPVPSEDMDSLRRIRSQFQTPIALGERLFTRWQFKDLLANNLVDIIQPDVGNVGGLSEMRVLADMAEAHSVVLNPHSPNGRLHTAASMHAAAITQTFGALEFRESGNLGNDPFLGDVFAVGADGAFAVSDSAGLGVAVDVDRLHFDEKMVPVLAETLPDGTPAEW